MSRAPRYKKRNIAGYLAIGIALLAYTAEGSKKMPLTAVVEVPADQIDVRAFHIRLHITNPTPRGISILNPDMGTPSPAMNWPFSKEAYQTALLISFSYLSISVTDEQGNKLARQTIQTWATPVLKPRLELAPGDSFEVLIPIGNFFQLEAGKTYQIALEYGDQSLKVAARSSITVQ